ncbi:MAG: ribosome small subunit-dependent GTPase A [Myxococcota bacterium]
MMDDDTWELRSRDRQRLSRRSNKRRTKKKGSRRDSASPERLDGPTAGGVVIEANAQAGSVVLSDGRTVLATLSSRVLSHGGLCVGDEVTVRLGVHDTAVVERVAKRRTLLVRTHPQVRHRELTIVANVDAIGIVSAASDPPFRPRLVDRYLVAIERSGASPFLVINKLDEADATRQAELDDLLEPYGALDLPTYRVSAATGEGMNALIEALRGQRLAFVGHSGVGKSSLVTAMGASAVVGGLAEHGRGRHTTSSSTLHRFEGGTEIIDTPGVRQFGLPKLTLRQLQQAFTDFEPFAAGCAFASCRHADEPNCAVRNAVEEGALSAARYDSYRRLLAAL